MLGTPKHNHEGECLVEHIGQSVISLSIGVKPADTLKKSISPNTMSVFYPNLAEAICCNYTPAQDRSKCLCLARIARLLRLVAASCRHRKGDNVSVISA